MSLTRVRQVAIKLESVEGVAETLAADDFRGERKGDVPDYTLGNYEREGDRATLSKRPNVKGGSRLLKLSWQEECVGGGASTEAPWHRTLMGMGFESTGIKVITVGSRTGGEYALGQLIGNNATYGSATKTGRVVAILTGGKLVYLPITGTFVSSDVIYNYATSQVSATASSGASAAGYAFTPLTETESESPKSGTVELRLAGEKHTIVGGRGKGSFAFAIDKPALLSAEYTGPAVGDAANDYEPYSSSPMAGVTVVGGPPALCKATRTRIGTATPILTKCDIKIDNTLAPRGTISDADVSGSGFLATRITDRKIMVSVDPEHTAGGTFDSWPAAVKGTTFELTTAAGTPSATNGQVIVYVPAAMIPESIGVGDRDGIVTDEFDALATGTDDDEIYIFHVFVA
jgi:hypothetical protein